MIAVKPIPLNSGLEEVPMPLAPRLIGLLVFFLVLAARDEQTLKGLAPEFWEKGREPIVSVAAEGHDRHYLAMWRTPGSRTTCG